MKLSPALQSLETALQIPIHASIRPACCLVIPSFRRPQSHTQTSTFSTTLNTLAKNTGRPKQDPRITLIRYHLHHPLTPRPLRLSRQRALRHWTIHRAAQLLLHRNRYLRERELERQYNAMRGAMEELRLGVGDGGRLYRQAVSRKGIYGGLKVGEMDGVVTNGGIPVEYARAQTDGPPRVGWDHSWTRG
ncbi:hypothetical protein ABVK25_007327 [Lepraria finkii]|uniref:Uncharacterized protein n=1 Tax=Lepraria finkii TaxID=1340010 RepID=A0ABR4B4D4_9LECA